MKESTTKLREPILERTENRNNDCGAFSDCRSFLSVVVLPTIVVGAIFSLVYLFVAYAAAAGASAGDLPYSTTPTPGSNTTNPVNATTDAGIATTDDILKAGIRFLESLDSESYTLRGSRNNP